MRPNFARSEFRQALLSFSGRSAGIGERNYPIVLVRLLLIIILASGLGMPRSASACGDPPPATVLTFIVIALGPPVTVTLIFDPWTTFASSSTQFCSCAFRFPTALIESIDAVRLVESGTDTVITGFGTWTANTTTSADVESQLGAGTGNEWFGFLNDLSASVTGDVPADFQVDVTLKAGITLGDLSAAYMADGASRVFSDEADSSGMPTGAHGGFVNAQVPMVPALSPMGLAVLGLLLMAVIAVAIVRRRATA